ncbi:unnamed protein product [Rotaria sp. Silwood2]|nr:unnamed protein product [Rotaria sp. Silwood2]CAF4054173.1 unnamed protein product [Rotaria sp. Silwood2]CAF4479153.1 unnamed protein product [Rotaria sp. Silwood2]
MSTFRSRDFSSTPSDTIERKAINPAGRLGSLYDGCRDRIIHETHPNCQEEWLQSSEPVECKVINGNMDLNFNILQSIDIQQELRLSLLLKMTKRSGIAEIICYPHRIDHYTRFFYYSWTGDKQQLLENGMHVLKNMKIWNPALNATHMITSITFGIDTLVVLQLPSEDTAVNKIDRILEKIRDELLRDKNSILKLTPEDNDLLEKTFNTKVYSNISSLTSLTKVSDVFSQINKIKMNSCCRYPLSYTLQLVTKLCPSDSRTSMTLSHPLQMKKADQFKFLSSLLQEKLEQFLLQLRNPIQYVDASLNESIPKLFCGHLSSKLNKANIQWLSLKNKYRNNIQQFSKLIIDARSGLGKSFTIDRALRDNVQRTMKNDINKLICNVNELEKKGHLITGLHQQQFKYWNTAEYNIGKSNDIKTIERMLISNDRRRRIICSSDNLNENNPSKLVDLRRTLFEKYKSNPELHLIYADFSYTSFQLHDMMVLSLDKNDDSENHSMQRASSAVSVLQTSLILPSSPSPLLTNDETINILLLGETGVGKSTFINAFANYLIFHSFEQAESNEPVVIIPVSFIITIGDNFEERIIKFGEVDCFNNENFNIFGQSVTQHCKSYVFALNNGDSRKVRIIDSPGFGDTRGHDQDDRNMEHTLQYINNLTHLNAICFLLKPNASQLSFSFRTCLSQLFSLLGPTARNNIIFCFTNARSTFYKPGNTASLLKNILASISMSDISLKKENTFCFDSESFRYLVALQNEVPFTDEEKQKYDRSWSTSVNESHRLIDYIDKELTVYRIENEWQSIKHAQFEISYMIRPILEAMRNILRNIILCKKNISNQFIELNSKPLHFTATRCRSCKDSLQQVGQFCILSTCPHEIQNECFMCTCTIDQHVPINYILDHKCSNFSSSDLQNRMINILNKLCHASVELAYFLISTTCSTKDDPFLNALVEMIVEETYICEIQTTNDFNKQLVQELSKLESQYEQQMSKMKSTNENIDLPAIEKLIMNISEYSIIRVQMTAVKKGRQMMIEEYEYEVQKI